jgi:hypothetical protein
MTAMISNNKKKQPEMPGGLKVLLFRLVLVAGAAAATVIGLNPRWGVLIIAFSILFWGVLRTYDDWTSFIKRCLSAIPFIVLAEIGLHLFLRPARYNYWGIGGFLSLMLLLNVQKAWPHYCITLLTLTAATATVIIREKWDAGITYFLFGSVFLTFFYASYFGMLNRKSDYTFLTIRSAVAGMLGMLFAWIFIVLHRLPTQDEFSPEIYFGFFCLLGLCCFLVFYGLGKKYCKDNDLFQKGQITDLTCAYLEEIKESFA